MASSTSLSNDNLVSRALKMLVRLRLPQWQETQTDAEVPLIFREKYMHSGYRTPYKSWGYYLKSLFSIHNESGNVWSHFIALFIFIYKVFQIGRKVDYWNEPLSWPILGFCAGIITYAILSTYAHLFQSKSPLAHYTCFQIDYIGIGMNGYGTACIVYYLTGTESYYRIFPPAVFMTSNVIIAILVCIGCSVAKLKYRRPYPVQRKVWQIGSVGSHALFGTLPFFCHLFNCAFYDTECRILDNTTELKVVFLFVSSAFFFASSMPERFSPGMFDIVGHGHQIFHVLMIFTSLLQIRGGLERMINRPQALTSLATPHFGTIFGGAFIVIALDVVFILLTHGYRKSKVEDDARFESSLTCDEYLNHRKES